MSKRREKKNLKSSLLVLLLIAILLIASTYAWFTANRTVTISSLDVNVQASNGLQISTDAVNWKAVITSSDITGGAYSGNVNQIPTEMVPMSTDGTVAGDGTMNMFLGTMAPITTAGDPNYGKYALTATQETDEDQEGKYIIFDIFLKADEPMDLTLTADSTVTPKENSADKGLQNAARVAFVNEGNVASTAASSALTLMDGTESVVWEPNADKHTADAIANNPYGGSVTDGTKVTYYGVKTAITAPILRETINSGTDQTHFGSVANLISTNQASAETAGFLSIEAGITKVRVYMWVEGQDVDCDNSASGTDITFNVQFNAPEN